MIQRMGALPAYEVPNKLLDLSPISSALSGYQQQMNTNAQFGLQREQMDLRKREYDDQDRQRVADRIGRLADMYLNEPDQNRRQAIGSGLLKMHPEMAVKLREAGIDTNNMDTVAQFLRAETSGYDPLKRKKDEAEISRIGAQTRLANAQADFAQSRAKAAIAPPEPPAPDRLAGAGLNEDGEIVTGGQGGQSRGFSVPDYVPQGGGTPTAPGVIVQGGNRFSPPMRLGGPMDDIDRSMRLDEGRPQGVRVAQAGGTVPGSVRPELMDQAMSRFGRTGMTSPEVPGMVTDAGRNRRVDVPATREMQGQRAFSQASPEEQDRLMKFRQDQELWTGIYKRQPRAGYYYGTDGREMPLTDKNYKGDREQQAVSLMNMNKIEAAGDVLLGKRTGRVDENGQPIRESGPFLATRAIAGYGNIGEIGQAFADMRQGALGIAYALSGKTVAVAEMKNFIDAYGPTPLDSPERIANKMERIRQFYQALLTASRGGESYETAFARAMAATGLKNPDGTPAGAPAAASGGTTPRGQPAPTGSVRDLPTDELVRRLNGGR